MTNKIKVIDKEIKPKSMGLIILLENLKEELEETVSKEIKRQNLLGANLIKLCDKANNIDNENLQNHIGEYEFNHYTDFYLMKLSCKVQKEPKDGLTLEELKKEDITKFIKIYEESFKGVPNSSTYDYDTVVEMLENTEMKIGFIKYKDEVAGFYELTFEQGEGAELTAIGIKPSFRDKYLGRSTIELINEEFYKAGYKYTKLLVASANEKAFGLYKKMGFEIVGERYSRWYHCEL